MEHFFIHCKTLEWFETFNQLEHGNPFYSQKHKTYINLNIETFTLEKQ